MSLGRLQRRYRQYLGFGYTVSKFLVMSKLIAEAPHAH